MHVFVCSGMEWMEWRLAEANSPQLPRAESAPLIAQKRARAKVQRRPAVAGNAKQFAVTNWQIRDENVVVQ